jgi:hypothetical protein
MIFWNIKYFASQYNRARALTFEYLKKCKLKLWEAHMFKYLSIMIGICLVASSALGADSLNKINEPQNFRDLTVEEKWLPIQTFEIRDKLKDDHKKYSYSKSTFNIWKSDSISFPLTFKIKSLGIPKVKLAFKATF